MQPIKPSPGQNPKRDAMRAVAKYGGMAFQLFGACLAGVFLGRWLDGQMNMSRPTWAVFLTIFFMLGSLYSLYRQLLKDQ
jgi:hypothetical protein